MDQRLLDASRLLPARLALLHQLRRGPSTRKALADATTLSPSFVAGLVREMIAEGIVEEAAERLPSGGRKAELLRVSRKAGLVVGLDLGASHPRAVLVDLSGGVIHRWESRGGDRQATPIPVSRMVDVAKDSIEQVVREASIEPSGLIAVGAALRGFVDPEEGRCVEPDHRRQQGVPIREQIADTIGLPTFVEEVTRSRALAELNYGKADRSPGFIYLLLDDVVGSAVWSNGTLYRGTHGMGVEIGHVTLRPNGRYCVCGNRGCVQTVCATGALVRAAVAALAEGAPSALADLGPGDRASLTFDHLRIALQAGDRLAANLVTSAGEYLGEALGIALNLFGLDRVIVGGEVATACPSLVEEAGRVARKRVFPDLADRLTLAPSAVDGFAAALGVASLAIDEVISAPHRFITSERGQSLPGHRRALGWGQRTAPLPLNSV